MHYGMFGNIPDIRKKYGLVKGNEPNVTDPKKDVHQALTIMMRCLPRILMCLPWC